MRRVMVGRSFRASRSLWHMTVTESFTPIARLSESSRLRTTLGQRSSLMAKLKKANRKKPERDKSVAREKKLVKNPGVQMPDWITTDLSGGKLGIECPRTVVTH